jgi:hypothetical protein
MQKSWLFQTRIKLPTPAIPLVSVKISTSLLYQTIFIKEVSLAALACVSYTYVLAGKWKFKIVLFCFNVICEKKKLLFLKAVCEEASEREHYSLFVMVA